MKVNMTDTSPISVNDVRGKKGVITVFLIMLFLAVLAVFYNTITDGDLMNRIRRVKAEQEYFAIVDDMVKEMDNAFGVALDVYSGASDPETNKEYLKLMATFDKRIDNMSANIDELHNTLMSQGMPENEINEIETKAIIRFVDGVTDSENLWIMDVVNPGFSERLIQWAEDTKNGSLNGSSNNEVLNETESSSDYELEDEENTDSSEFQETHNIYQTLADYEQQYTITAEEEQMKQQLKKNDCERMEVITNGMV